MIMLSDATLTKVLAATEAKAMQRAMALNREGDGETFYRARANSLGAWIVEAYAPNGDIVFTEVIGEAKDALGRAKSELLRLWR